MTALQRPALRLLVDELARRLGDGGVPVTIAVADLCRPALADLLGLDRIPAPGGRVRVERLVVALGLPSVDALRSEVESIVGPLPTLAGDRRAERTRREELWEWLQLSAASVTLGVRLDEWVASQRARGARGGVAHRRVELSKALDVLSRLPADGVALASLAADVSGGPHGLDHGRSLSAIVLDAVAVATGCDRPANASEARALWESVGVAPDPLSSNVLVLGLPGGDDPLGAWLDSCRECSEPVSLTLANLRRWRRPALRVTDAVFVVENPSLLAEAAARGWDGPPLVCSSGRPTVAVVTLLRQLGAGGASLYQHADFDPAGISITAWLQERAGTQPWLMGAANYLGALRSREASFNTVPPTPWDPHLQSAMTERAEPVYEEDVREVLLATARESR